MSKLKDSIYAVLERQLTSIAKRHSDKYELTTYVGYHSLKSTFKVKGEDQPINSEIIDIEYGNLPEHKLVNKDDVLFVSLSSWAVSNYSEDVMNNFMYQFINSITDLITEFKFKITRTNWITEDFIVITFFDDNNYCSVRMSKMKSYIC